LIKWKYTICHTFASQEGIIIIVLNMLRHTRTICFTLNSLCHAI
jgi:hypothetical protein